MKKMIFLIVVVFLLLSGCSIKDPLQNLPDNEFEIFEYHRHGPIGNTHILAKNGVKIGDKVQIEDVDINADYGPTMPKFVIKLKGYKR